MAKHLKKTRGVMNLLIKEECEKALDHFEKSYWDQDNSYGAMNGVRKDLDILNKLIHEYFSNPPLEFEELEEGMWIWDNYWEEYFEISEVYSNTKEIDVLIHQNKINQKRYETIKYTPNRFYRKQVKE